MKCPDCNSEMIKIENTEQWICKEDMFDITESIAERWQARAEKAESKLERERVRLAGCGVVALGCKEHDIKKDDYGYSASYQDVLNLRNKYEKAESELNAIRDRIEAVKITDLYEIKERNKNFGCEDMQEIYHLIKQIGGEK